MFPLRARLPRFLLLGSLLVGAWSLPARDSTPADSGTELIHLEPFGVEGVGLFGVRPRPEKTSITADDASPASAASLTTALPAIPGLVLQEGGDGFYPPRITARGSGLQSAPVSRGLLFRIDSLPFNAADGSFNLALLEPGFFGVVSFQPGGFDPTAAVQSLGGAFDLFWWQNILNYWSSENASGAASVTAGSNGMFHAVLRAEGRTKDDLGLGPRPMGESGAVAVTRGDGWRPNSAQERLAAAVRASWPSHGGLTHVLSLYAARADLRIPGPLTLAAAAAKPDTIAAAAAADLPRRTTDLARLVYRASWADGPNVAVGVQATDDDFRQLRANGVAVTRGADWFARVADSWELGRVRFEAELTGNFGSRSQERFANVDGSRGARFADLELEASTLTGSLDVLWKPVRKVMLKTGVSAVAVRREVAGTATAAGEMRASRLAPHLEIVVPAPSAGGWNPLEGFVRVDRGVEAPTFDDLLVVRGAAPNLALGWTPLRPQQADTLSVGLRGSFGNRMMRPERFWFDLSAYAANWRDEILRLADVNGTPRGAVNAESTRHRGIASQLRWRIFRGSPFVGGPPPVDLLLGHTWSEARFRHDAVYGTRLIAGLPPHVGTAQLSWGGTDGLTAKVGAQWVWGTTYADHAGTLGYSGHTLANAGLSWCDDHWTLSLEVNNLFDRRYIASSAGVLDLARTPATTALFLPGNPRSFNVTFERRW